MVFRSPQEFHSPTFAIRLDRKRSRIHRLLSAQPTNKPSVHRAPEKRFPHPDLCKSPDDYVEDRHFSLYAPSHCFSLYAPSHYFLSSTAEGAIEYGRRFEYNAYGGGAHSGFSSGALFKRSTHSRHNLLSPSEHSSQKSIEPPPCAAYLRPQIHIAISAGLCGFRLRRFLSILVSSLTASSPDPPRCCPR